MAEYLVLEEDGTSHLTLEETGGSLLLEESVANVPAGLALVDSSSAAVTVTSLAGVAVGVQDAQEAAVAVLGGS